MLIGIDPEVFVREKETGKIVSAIGKVGGTKEAPLKVQAGAVQEDNVMAEINITPVSTLKDFQQNIETVLAELDHILNKSGLEYDKTFKTSHTFPFKDTNNPQAMRFGCDPDINVYTMEENPVIKPISVKQLRMCGGHIHLGFNAPDDHPLLRVLAVQWMDILVGAPLSEFDPDIEFRPKFYGKMGNFRMKPYGVEYRTPSNFWMGHPLLREFVFNQTLTAMSRAESNAFPDRYIRQTFAESMDTWFLQSRDRMGAILEQSKIPRINKIIRAIEVGRGRIGGSQ